MNKVICSPSKYVQGPSLIGEFANMTEELGKESAYILAGGTVHRKYKDDVLKGFKDKGFKYDFVDFGGEISDEEIEKHVENSKDYDIIIGIGGGKILDTAKAVAYKADKPVIISPTAASTDAPCSRLSVVYTETGEFSYYLFLPSNPNIVSVDTDVIIQAPKRFLTSGMGDALATYFEAEACKESGAMTTAGGKPTRAANVMPKLCLDTLLEYGVEALEAVDKGERNEAFENIVEANTYLSGVGFESGGIAGAHAIHNGMTALEETHDYLHGEKVAVGTLAQLVLEKRPDEEIQKIKKFCEDVGLPTKLADVGVENQDRDRLIEVGKIALDENDTMINMPFEVTPDMIADALLELNNL